MLFIENSTSAFTPTTMSLGTAPSMLATWFSLSARPHVYKDVSEVQSYRKFRDLQEKRGLHTSPTLLAGSLAAGGQFMVGGDIEPVAEKKYSNLKEYLSLYPEYSCLYIGDNGQGDVRAAEMLLNEEIVVGQDEGKVKSQMITLRGIILKT